MNTMNLLSDTEIAKLDRAMAKARHGAPLQTVKITRRFPRPLSRTSVEARFASWQRVDAEASRLLFNVSEFGAQPGDRRKLAKLSRALTKALVGLK